MIKLILHKIMIQLKQKQSVSAFEITLFLRQFATLITAGIPIIPSCHILEKTQENKSMQLVINSIKKEIEAGKNLFSALQRHPHYFDTLTCQLVQIGEQTGNLDTMLKTIANYKEKNFVYRRKIQQALFYPCLIMITAMVMTCVMFIFVIPQFAELFEHLHGQLPLLTRIIFSLSAQLLQHEWILFGLIVSIIFFIFYNRHSIHVKHYLGKLLLQLPIVKSIMQKTILSRFSQHLALTLRAGIPIIDAVKLAGSPTANPQFTKIIAKLRTQIIAGHSLYYAMQSLSYFPPLMIQMIKVGEESGMLENMLDKIAEFFESDIDQLINQLGQLLEPLIMIILGVLIGGLVIAMYLPVFKLGTVI